MATNNQESGGLTGTTNFFGYFLFLSTMTGEKGADVNDGDIAVGRMLQTHDYSICVVERQIAGSERPAATTWW